MEIEFKIRHKPTGKIFCPDDELESILHFDYIQHEDELVILPDGGVALFNSDRTYLYRTDDFEIIEITIKQ